MTILMNGKLYHRVTDVLFPFSGLGHIDKDILKQASDRGTYVHQVIDTILFGNELGYPSIDKWKGYIDSFEKWYDSKTFVKMPRMYCDDLMITGECDVLFQNETGYTLVDFKTSYKEGKTWVLQGSAYAYLCKKLDYEITEIKFVKLDKFGGKPSVFDYKENMGLFKDCLKIYEQFFQNNKDECLEDF